MKIGLLQCGHTAPLVVDNHGEYAEMFERLLAGKGRRFETWNVCDGEFPDSPHAADAWVMTGSPHGVYEPLAFIAPLEGFARQAISAGVPLAGICFGHQLIAQATGGTVIKHPGGWRMGPQGYTVAGEVRPIWMHAWHQDQVVEAPGEAEVIATGPDCAIAGFAIGTHVLTLQAHPEFTDRVVGDLIAARRGAPGYENAPIADAQERLGQPIDCDWAAARLGQFLERAGAHAEG